MYKQIASWLPTAIGFAAGALALATPASAQTAGKPNILVIMGDDIGLWNISAYNRGQMGYRTPNIDRIANEGAIFTDYYGQQSCTAGRAAFITGQSPIRTGLLKVGLPGAPEGLSEKDPTIADLLKPQGYMTGQFGKNHLGDRNEFLPTVHGFDEFFGNLYHLKGKTGLGVYADGMREHDNQVGELLKKLDDLKIADNTIVIYTTDNGAEVMSWPDGGSTPFRGEKNTNWEGGYRVPTMVRWPGLVKPGTEINEIFSAEDWTQTLLGAVGEPDLQAKLKQGATFGATTFKVYLDSYDQRELLRNGSGGGRKEFFYWTDDGGLAGLRFNKWKLVFMEQRSHGFDVWQDPMVTLRVPKLFDLRADPFERADHEGMGYARWRIDRIFLLVPAQAFVGNYIKTLAEFPPRQKPGSFNLQGVLDKLTAPPEGVN